MTQNLKMKNGFKVGAVIVLVLAAAYLAIPADDWSDSRLFAFGLLWFVSGIWVAQDHRIWGQELPSNSGDDLPKC